MPIEQIMNLKSLRARAGMTQEQAAVALCVTRARIVDGQAYYLIGTNTWIGGKDTK